MSNENRTKVFLLGVLIGGMAGGLIALLYAPESGKRLRNDIGKKKDELMDEAGKFLDKTKTKASNFVENGKKKAEEIVSEAKREAVLLTKGAGKVFTRG